MIFLNRACADAQALFLSVGKEEQQDFFCAAVYIPSAVDIFPPEADIVNFRYFDATGKQLTREQLKTMNIVTPAMEHIFATVAERAGKSRMPSNELEKPEQR